MSTARAGRALAVLVAALLAVAVIAPAAHAEDTASISGRISDALTTRPLVGATVINTDVGTVTTTDEDGMFVFSGLAAGSYRVTATMSGFVTQTSEWYSIAEGEAKSGVDVGLTVAGVQGRSATVTGIRAVGQTLVAVPGAWSPSSTVLSYQWFRGSTPISGATAQSYVLAAVDIGKVVNVVVTGVIEGYPPVSRPGRQFFATAEGVFTAPAEIALAGIPTVGAPLSLSWSGVFLPAPTTVSYQWFVADQAVTGATGAAYTPRPADLGKAVSALVTATRAGVETLSVPVVSSDVVQPGVLVSTAAPVVSAARVGAQATASTGSWSPTAASFAYEWYRDGILVGAARTYTPSSADLGGQLSVVVTASLTGFASSSRASAPTTVLGGLFTSAPRPTISGSPTVGSTLGANLGAWVPGGASFSYQWKVGGLVVGGATGSTYAVRPTDADRSISVTVTAAKAGYATTTLESAPTSAVVGRAYSLCEYLLADYPYGVMKNSSVKDAVKKKNAPTQYLEPYGPPFVSASVYALNASGRDADKDGIACEQRP